MIQQCVTAFLLGALYEASAVLWAVASVRGDPSRAALASSLCGLCVVGGVGMSLGSAWVASSYAVGYGVGTWLAVRR